jgi:RNA recognition motif-containing protein
LHGDLGNAGGLIKEFLVKLHFGNLAPEVSDQQLNDLVTPFGTITSAEIVKDRLSGVSRGYGFVVFAEPAAAQAAAEKLNGTDLQGKVIRVSDARAPKQKVLAEL